MKLFKCFSIFCVCFTLLISCGKEVFVEAKEDDAFYKNAMVKITSNPPGALVYIDGKTTGFTTPFSLRVYEAGNHHFTFKKDLFPDTTITNLIDLSKNDSIAIDYSKNTRMLASISINSQPEEAEIYMNGENTGRKTPYRFTNLMPGAYKICLKLKEYWDETDSLILKSSVLENRNYLLNDSLDLVLYVKSKSPIGSAGCMGEDKNGNLWFGTNENLVKYDNKSFTKYFENKDYFMMSIWIHEIKNDLKKNLFVSFSNGIAKYNGQTWDCFRTGYNRSLSVSDDKAAAGTERNGLAAYKDGNFVIYSTENSGLKSGEIDCATWDGQGRLWGLNIGYGMNVFDGRNWTYLKAEKGETPTNKFILLEADKNGIIHGVYNLYEGTSAEKFVCVKYENGVWKKVADFPQGSFINRKTKIYVDIDKNLWIGNYRLKEGGLPEHISTIVDYKKMRRFKSEWGYSFQPEFFGTTTHVDTKGNLWVLGGIYGAVKIKPGKWNR